MKTSHQIISLVALSIGSTQANWERIMDDFSSNADAINNLRSARGDDRAITASDMALVNEYGCWCYFQDDHHKGRGQPVDALDHLCKQLHDGYTCAMHDARQSGDFSCVPWNIFYNSAVGTGLGINMDIETLRTECGQQNPLPSFNPCANWACRIEGYFVQQLIFFFVNGNQMDSSLNHSNGFDPMVSCPTTTGIDSDKECCNEQPLRFPYKTYEGGRGCCNDRTYDTTVWQCCNDGSLAMGVCPLPIGK